MTNFCLKPETEFQNQATKTKIIMIILIGEAQPTSHDQIKNETMNTDYSQADKIQKQNLEGED